MTASPRRAIGATERSPEIIGDHDSIRELREAIALAAPAPIPILIVGETGVGKELVAQALHAHSGRSGRLVSVNAAAIPEPLADSELFGSVRGAYTGALDRPGLFERADGGTLYLDEASDLSPQLQLKLLRAVEAGCVRRVGDGRDRVAAPRVVLSTQEDPHALVGCGRWRRDFYYRAAGIVLRVPPLRARPSDVPLLANRFLEAVGRPPLPAEAYAPWEGHDWPGNVRELRHAVERAAFLAGPYALTAVSLGSLLAADGCDRPGRDTGTGGGRTLREAERAHVSEVLSRTRSVRLAAAELGVSRFALYRRLKRLGLPVTGLAGSGT